MISKSLLLKCYEAASMPRWGEYARPVELDELGRQGQMMQIAFVIGSEARCWSPLRWERLIELALIRFFRRIAITDIQAPVFDRLYSKRRLELNAYALEEMHNLVASVPGSFSDRFVAYLSEPRADPSYIVERRVLDAASALVNKWELDLISPVNQTSAWFAEARTQVEALVQRCVDGQLDGEVSALLDDGTFLEATGRLRIQRRWSRLATMPAFNVAGHSFIVALLTWAAHVNELGADRDVLADELDQETANAFFGALFHDIGEALTRDVINPVKRGGGVEDLLKDIEIESLEERLWPHIPHGTAQRLSEFARLEFGSGEVWGSPYDGALIDRCDKIAAVAELTVTIANGVAAPELEDIRTESCRSFQGGPGAGLAAALCERSRHQ